MIEAQGDELRALEGALSSVGLDESASTKDPERGDLLTGAAQIHAQVLELMKLVRLREGESSPRNSRRS
jgi:hypothetical protein